MRLINADKLKEDMSKRQIKQRDLNASFFAVINEQPTVEAEPIRHGHWIRPYHDHYKQCSVCERIHYTIPWNAAYCPFCGAKMDGGDL